MEDTSTNIRAANFADAEEIPRVPVERAMTESFRRVSSTLYQSLNEVRHGHYVNQRMAEVK